MVVQGLGFRVWGADQGDLHPLGAGHEDHTRRALLQEGWLTLPLRGSYRALWDSGRWFKSALVPMDVGGISGLGWVGAQQHPSQQPRFASSGLEWTRRGALHPPRLFQHVGSVLSC